MPAAALKIALKRGALVAAANWPVVAIQFLAEAVFKGLLMVPVIGAVSLMTLLVGGTAGDLLSLGLQGALAGAVETLSAHPRALAAYLVGLVAVVAGGSALMFFVKGGTVAVLLDGERAAPSIEAPPLSLSRVRQASRYSIDAFLAACDRYARRFLRLGLFLLAVYGISGLAYLVVMASLFGGDEGGWTIAGSIGAAMWSLAFGAWITVVNLLYLLTQILVVGGNWSVRRAAAALPVLLRAEFRAIAGLFLLMLALVLCATVASVLATGALGFIGFVPVVGLAVLPLQLLAWLARGLLFQFLGLAALGAYGGVARRALQPDSAAQTASVPVWRNLEAPREL
jgi:hypothetical protein